MKQGPHRIAPAAIGSAGPILQTAVAAFVGRRHRIHVACDPAVQLPAAKLAAVGMIVSEAIANALKHAFQGSSEGDIWVRLAEADGRLTLVIRDNGIGMTDSIGEEHTGRGMIERLARELGGYARLGSANFGGAEVSVIFPKSS